MVGECRHLGIVEEDSVRNICSGDKGILKFCVDIDGLVVNLDVGILLIEVSDGIFEDSEEVTRAVPNGDFAAWGFFRRGL